MHYRWILRLVSLLVEFLFKQRADSDQEISCFCTSVLSLLLSLAVTTAAQPTYLYHICPNTTTFARNSTYENNLDSVLTSLSKNTHLRDGFYSYYSGDEVPDQVFGVSMCTAGLSSDICQNCVRNATRKIVQDCPVEKIAIIWYDECLLHYSNYNIFSVLETSPMLYMWNTRNVTDPAGFSELLVTTMRETTTEASKGATKFAAKEVSTEFVKLYTLAQCTSDLSAADCNRCLETLVSKLPACCGGRVLTASCNIRFETHPFYDKTGYKPDIYSYYNTTVIGEFPTSPTPPSLSPTRIRPEEGSGGISTVTIIVIVASISCIVLALARRQYSNTDVNDFITVESIQVDLSMIQRATNNFSEDHKLGEGGFGEVYKGIFPNGQEIAVKKLSKGSVQGSEEFKNEVLLLAKLIHRNLVRLLGFCLQGEEKILVYEYMPNKSLDFFLFDEEKRKELDWSTRYKIIEGIGRGILYIHQDSRLRIIHRDLKASNVLLDRDMNAKISDFGMAKLFAVDQTQGNTSRIVGTYGYMSPEYAMHGQFSVKSDMYSFGVLVLEIICGKKNSSFYQTDGANNLSSYVWKHWREGTPMEVLDPVLADSCSRNEVLRCIQIGLLCVQEDPADRPTMTTVILMLNSYSVTLPMPQQPAFLLQSRSGDSWPNKGLASDSYSTTVKSVSDSVDEASITQVYPR